jgi:glutathione S-transferase
MAPHLVSSKICPFVQRAVILLLAKGVAHEVTYIDLANKPEWFTQQSPRSKVPILIVGDVVLFESQAICEYLDETTGGDRLTPADPLLRARDRAWFPFAGEDLFAPVFKAMISASPEDVELQKKELSSKLDRLALEKHGPYLSGDGSRFGLADVAIAPAFTRIAFIGRLTQSDWLAGYPSLGDYSRRLLERPEVARSVPDDFESAMLALMKKRQSCLLPAA